MAFGQSIPQVFAHLIGAHHAAAGQLRQLRRKAVHAAQVAAQTAKIVCCVAACVPHDKKSQRAGGKHRSQNIEHRHCAPQACIIGCHTGKDGHNQRSNGKAATEHPAQHAHGHPAAVMPGQAVIQLTAVGNKAVLFRPLRGPVQGIPHTVQCAGNTGKHRGTDAQPKVDGTIHQVIQILLAAVTFFIIRVIVGHSGSSFSSHSLRFFTRFVISTSCQALQFRLYPGRTAASGQRRSAHRPRRRS